MIFPVKEYRITQGYHSGHRAIDIAPKVRGDTNTPILSPNACTVVTAGTGKVEGKYCILQDHQTKMFYYFGHFARLDVTTGQKVKEGQRLGIMGQTGLATGIHTHHEVRTRRNSSYSGYKQLEPLDYYKENTVWYKVYEKYQDYKDDLFFIYGYYPKNLYANWTAKYKNWRTRNYLRQVAKTIHNNYVVRTKERDEARAEIKNRELTIAGLETQIKNLQSELDSVNKELGQMQSKLDACLSKNNDIITSIRTFIDWVISKLRRK